MAKKLNVKHLQTEGKKLNKKVRIELGDYFVDVDEIFSDRKVANVFNTLAKNSQYAQENNIDFEAVNIFDWIMFYTIKEFTSLGETIPEDLEGQIDVFNVLTDLGYYKQIAEGINRDELQKVFNRIQEINDLIEESMKTSDKFKAELDKLDLKVLNKEE